MNVNSFSDSKAGSGSKRKHSMCVFLYIYTFSYFLFKFENIHDSVYKVSMLKTFWRWGEREVTKF